MNLFDGREARAMLLTESGEPFDDPAFFYELKLDGIRALPYVGDSQTDIRNKRNQRVNHTYPELRELHAHIRGKAILDGEIVAMEDGKPSFEQVARRSLMSRPASVALAARQHPVSFVAYDVLYLDGEPLLRAPLRERKKILAEIVCEGERVALSRYISGNGVALYGQAKHTQLEGIVCKRADSTYQMGKRSRDWVKVKNMRDDDFAICGYIDNDDGITSIILGSPQEDGLMRYIGHVVMGVSCADMRRIRDQRTASAQDFPLFPPQPPNAVFLIPSLVCTVRYMERTASGGLRQPVFKGLRLD